MKCEKYGNDFPLDYYSETNIVRKSCFEELNEEEKKVAYKNNQTKTAKEETDKHLVYGVQLIYRFVNMISFG